MTPRAWRMIIALGCGAWLGVESPVQAAPASAPETSAPKTSAPDSSQSPAPPPASSDIVAPAVVAAPVVPYPESGTGWARVVLEAEIAEDGSVVRASLREGAEPFASAARQGVEKWRFTPALRGGLPVRARILVAVDFEPHTPAAPESGAASAGAASPMMAPRLLPPAAAPVTVVVTSAERQEIGAIYVPRHEARLVPGAFADPFRVIEVMPGVAPILSGIPYFYVRGAPPGDVGYLIDGIRVPLLFHVGAGPSVIAPALVDRVDLFSAAYPARYGRYSGALMAGETTAPSEWARGEAQARVFDAGAMIEVPFDASRGSVLVGGRYSYTQALLALVAPDFELGYWDYQARVTYRTSESQRLTLLAFGALDRLQKKSQPVPLFDTHFHRVDLRWERSTASGHTRAALTFGEERTALSEEDAPQEASEQALHSLGVRLQHEQTFSREWRARGGLEAGVDAIDAEREGDFGQSIDFGARTDLRVEAYADAVYRPRSTLELVPGVRLERVRSRDRWFSHAEPRLAARVGLGRGVAWESAFGLAHQLPALSVRTPARNPNALERSAQAAYQAAESLEVSLPASLLGKITGFHSWTDAGPISSRNYGLELFLRRDFTRRLGGFLSYTLSWADGAAGSFEFPTAYDRRHLLSLVLGYRFGAGYRLGGRAYYNSGRPFSYPCATPRCGPADPAAPRPYLIEGRFPDFLRADVRFEKRWDLSGGRWLAATFEWFNAGMARERDGIAWSPERGGLRFTSRSALTLPSVGIEGGF